jgi:hypothetical protein
MTRGDKNSTDWKAAYRFHVAELLGKPLTPVGAIFVVQEGRHLGNIYLHQRYSPLKIGN